MNPSTNGSNDHNRRMIARSNRDPTREPSSKYAPASTNGGLGAPKGASRRQGGAGAGAPVRRQTPRGLGGEQVEGRQAVRELLLAGTRRVREVWVAQGERDLDEPLEELAELARELRATVKVVGRAKLDDTARTEAPQGVVAFAAPLPEADLDDLLRTRKVRRPGAGGGDEIVTVVPFLVAVDGVTDPGNLGALLRSAECAGATGVLLARHRAVHVTPTVTKAAAGAVERLPMAVVGGLAATLERCKAAGLWVVGLDGGGDTPLHELTVARDPVVLVLGAEGSGLSRLVRQRCDVVASIPLRGQLGSLNVAAAAAIATYEVARHRAAPAAPPFATTAVPSPPPRPLRAGGQDR